MRAGKLAAAVLAAAAGTAAAQPTDTFQVSATVTEGCLVNGEVPSSGAQVGELGALDFGTDTSLSQATHTAALVPSGTFSLRCTSGINVTISINGGLHQDANRRLQLNTGTDTIDYFLFQDAAFSNAIGINQPVAIDTNTADPDNTDLTLPIWGRLTLPGNVAPGLYQDDLVVTISW